MEGDIKLRPLYKIPDLDVLCQFIKFYFIVGAGKEWITENFKSENSKKLKCTAFLTSKYVTFQPSLPEYVWTGNIATKI